MLLQMLVVVANAAAVFLVAAGWCSLFVNRWGGTIHLVSYGIQRFGCFGVELKAGQSIYIREVHDAHHMIPP